MPRRKRNRALLEYLTLALLLVGLALLCQHQGWLWRWDNNIYDAQLRFWSRPASDNIIIIAIDEDSLSQLGRWPWSRQLHARLLERISGENPRAIAYDVIFAEPDLGNPDGDMEFADEIRNSGRVALPVFMEQPRPGALAIEILPLPLLGEPAAALGHVHVELDPDGIARRLFMWEGLGSPHWPHLSIALLQIADQLPEFTDHSQSEAAASPESMLVWTRTQSLLIPYAGPPGHFKQISFAQVMQGNFTPGTFSDKFILIGATATGIGDALPTPVSGFSHSMSGVEINANALDALLNDIHITPLDGGWQLAATGMLAFLPLLLFPYMAPRTNLLVTLSLILATLALTGVLLITLHSWFPPTAALLAIALSYPLWSWRRLEQAMRYLTQELDRLKEQQTHEAMEQTSSLEGSLDFLQHIMPLQGWCLVDMNGCIECRHGEAPRTAVNRISTGRWESIGNDLWTALNHHGQIKFLGLHWHASHPPDVQQRAVLIQLQQQFHVPEKPAASGMHEVVQARIQQVQQATAQVRELRRLVEDSLSNMADGVLVTNALGEIILSNTRASWYLRGNDNADLTGLSVMTLLEDLQIRDTDNWGGLLRRSLMENTRNQLEVRHHHGRQLLVQIAPLSRDMQQPGGLIMNFSDITPLKASENKRNELLNFLSHDLRSPLVSMLALLELAKKKNITEGTRELLTRMGNHAGKTLDLADQFLQLARVESGSESLLHDLDLVAVATNAIEQVWEHARMKSIHLKNNITLEDAWFHGEGNLLERALVNLLGNAIKFSEPGSTVQLELSRHRNEWHCCVVDEGEGIPAADLPRLFDRFQRVHRSNRPEQAGAGLGLAFVHAVARTHGGRIEVESAERQGSRFCLIMPVQQDTVKLVFG
jgi:CHASE2 domain-containing sensor protein/signal transduction histidine kinase